MQQQEAAQINLPLSIYKLVPEKHSQPTLNISILGELYNKLCCPICGCLMIVPVFLRCSHRFCKDCLEQQVKKVGDNRQCPICAVNSKWKKEVKEDFSISNIIHTVFGDTAKAREEIDSSERKVRDQAKNNLQNLRNKRVRMQAEDTPTKGKQKAENSSSPVKEPQMKKKKVAYEVVPMIIAVEDEVSTAEVIQRYERKYELHGYNFIDAVEKEVGITLSIAFQRFEDDYITGVLERPNLQTLTKVTVRQLITYLSIQLNLPDDPNIIRLSVLPLQKVALALEESPKKSASSSVELSDMSLSLSQINSQYWGGTSEDYKVLDAFDLVMDVREPHRLKPNEKRVIYYRVNFAHFE